MESILTTFHVDWKLLVAQVINFAVVALVLWWFGFKPLAKLLEGRAEKIEQGLTDAKAATERLQSAELEAKAIVTQARVESQAALAEAAQAASRLRADEVAAAKVEVEKTIAVGEAALLAEKAEIMKGIRSEVGELVVAATASVLKDTKAPAVDKVLAEKALAELK